MPTVSQTSRKPGPACFIASGLTKPALPSAVAAAVLPIRATTPLSIVCKVYRLVLTQGPANPAREATFVGKMGG